MERTRRRKRRGEDPPGWVCSVVDTNLAGPGIDWATGGNHRCGYTAVDGCRRCAWVLVGCQQAHSVGVQKPQSAGVCWPAEPPLRGPVGVTRRGQTSGVALQNSSPRLCGGLPRSLGRRSKRVWCWRTVSWEWLPGAPRFGEGRCMRIRMRVGWAPPFELWSVHSRALTRPPTPPGKNK